jgi:putative endonuclease
MGSDWRRRLGALGERFAREHLRSSGLAIVDRNFRTRHGELDVVASDARYLVFCEVKTRIASATPGPFGPLASVGARKQRQVRQMAREWLASRPAPRRRPPELRFDAIGVTVDAAGRLVELEHVENAF